jgi:photosystem II stability/assembly factor-like uncharacterized protein
MSCPTRASSRRRPRSGSARPTLLLAAFLVLGALLFALPPLARGAGAAPTAVAPRHTPHDDVNAVRPSPAFASDRTVFAIVRATAFRSRDGGHRFERLARGLGRRPLEDIALSPDFASDRTVFVAGFEGLLRSRDGGDTFEQVGAGLPGIGIARVFLADTFANDGRLLCLDSDGRPHASSDAGATCTPCGDEALVALAVLVERDGWLVAAEDGRLVHIDTTGALHERGRLPRNLVPSSLAREPDGAALVVGTRTGEVLRAPLGGDDAPLVFTRLGRGLEREPVTALAYVVADGAPTLLAATWRRGAHRLRADGSFERCADGLATDPQADLHERPHFSGLAPVGPNEVFLAGFCGVFHSRDGGRTWRERSALPHHLVMGLAVARAADGGQALALSTYGAGVAVRASAAADWVTNNRGLTSTRMTAVALSPDFASDGLVLSGTYDRICRSTDGGVHFELLPLEAGARVDPAADSRDLDSRPTPTLFAWSPDFASDRTVFACVHPRGVLCSSDAGSTWRQVEAGLPEACRSLVVSPAFARDRTLFASTKKGLWWSRDGGATFERVPAETAPLDAVLALSPAFEGDHTLLAGSPRGLFVSRDAGASFAALDLLPGDAPEVVATLALAPDFATSREFLVQLRAGALLVCRDLEAGLAVEVSAATAQGLEFSAMASFVREVSPLLVYSPDFATDRTVFGSDVERLARSTDGGRTWTCLPRRARYESRHARFTGDWRQEQDAAHGMRNRSSTPGSRASFAFVGTGITWIGVHGPRGGRAAVLVDGERVAVVDQFAPTVATAVSYRVEGLAAGPHEIAIEVLGPGDGETHAPGAARFVEIDAFDVELAP